MSVIYNQGTNYTLYYNALDYFKTIMTNHPSIAKVTTGDLMEVDTKEFPMYPIGNINIFNTNIQDSTTKFQIQLVIADKIKNKNNESNPVTNAQTIPFYGVDDTVDILANTLAIINDLTSYTEYSVAAFDIDSDIVCEPFVDRFNNGLAGHVATFTLTTHNDRNRCLFFLINPSGSGYEIRNCSTSQSYYAVLNTQVATGSVFSSTYPYSGVCYEVLQKVEEYDNWNLVGLPIETNWDICETCNGCYYDTLDIVRNGLIFAYDTYGYVSGSNILVDKSGYSRNAKITGSLNIIEGDAMEFTGDRNTWLLFPTQSSPEIYPPWQYTTQTNLSIPDTLPTNTYMKIASGGDSWRWIIDASGSTTLPNNLVWQSNLVNTTNNVITSSITNTTLTATGTEIYNPGYFTGTGSLINEYFNNDLLPNAGINSVPFRDFNWSANDMTFGKYDVYYGPSPIVIEWEALTADVKYILYYNRPLTAGEIKQNNDFFKCGKAIKNPATTTTTSTTSTTTTTTTLAPTTTTTTLAPTTTTTTLATGPLKLYEIFIFSGFGPGQVYYADCSGALKNFNMNNNGASDAKVRVASRIVPYGPNLNISDLGETTCGICYNVTIVGGGMDAFSCNSSGTGSFNFSLTEGQTGCVKATGQSSFGAAQWSWGSVCT